MKQQSLRSAFSAACLLVLALCLPALAHAATLNVPSQYSTIQAAISASVSGDTVLIADGTYTGYGNVDLSFSGRNITVTSQHGPASTIINCAGTTSANHRGFYLNGAETNVVISGLTIENGYVDNSNSGSTGQQLGGGIYDYDSGLTVQNCIIKNNTSYYGSGGGIYNVSYYSNRLISVIGCMITGNTAQNGGAGISNDAGGGPIAVTNCLITGNMANGNDGGGLFNATSDYNQTGRSNITVTNCTVTENMTFSGDGGGIYDSIYNGGQITLSNNIIYGDTGGDLASYSGSTADAAASHNDIEGGIPTGTTDSGGNINVDPKFESSLDQHLQPISPCFGVGTANGAPVTTLDGYARPNPPSIGAFEIGTMTTLTSSANPANSGQSITFTASVSGTGGTPTGGITFVIDGSAQSPVVLNNGVATYAISIFSTGLHSISAVYSGDANFPASTSSVLAQSITAYINPQYVSPLGNDSNPGTQAAPKLTIEAAINASSNGYTVIVEDGTYTGSGDVDLDFGGRNITVASQNGLAHAIIDCQGNANSIHRGFYLHSGETTAVIQGFTIQNGYESGSGGGLSTVGAGVSVLNCLFRDNACTGLGGGLASTGNYGQPASTTTLTDCLFIGNAAGYGGGGAANGGTMTLMNCVLIGNTTSNRYGGVYNFYGATLTMTNCTSTGNSGAGIGSDNGGVTLVNDILFADIGGEISGTPVSATYCDIQGGYTGTGNINADPLFVNSPADLHLGTGSPCLGTGTASGAPTTTIDGVTRPNPPSIGAYEGVPVATTVSVANVTGTAGQSVTLSATLTATSGGGLSGKTLSFSVDGVAAGTAGTNGMGTASLTYAIPGGTATGSHAISVTFAGDSAGNASSGTGTLTVTAPVPVGQVRFYPRTGYSSRMVGGLFQGSSDNVHWTTLAAVTQTPPVNRYSTLTTSADPATFRYLRYLAPNGSYGNVAEIEFDSHGVKLTGTGFGTAGSYNNNGNTFAKALDGNTGTFFDAPAPGNGDYVGIDRGTLTHTKLTGTAFGTAGSYKNDGNTFGNVFDGNLSTFFDAPAPGNGDYAGLDLGVGQAAIVTRIGYCPRSGYASRMVGGVFQGSNDNSSWTALYTVTAAPATGALTQTTAISSGTAYRYLRYLAPNGSYGNVSEVEFDTSP